MMLIRALGPAVGSGWIPALKIARGFGCSVVQAAISHKPKQRQKGHISAERKRASVLLPGCSGPTGGSGCLQTADALGPL